MVQRRSKPRRSFPQIKSDEFEQSLETLERRLQDLKTDYLQVCGTQRQWVERNEEVETLEQEAVTPELAMQLTEIQTALKTLELELEGRFFSWHGFADLFWQVVRFTGLGIVLGWVLKSCAG
jgi:hypothetical protein